MGDRDRPARLDLVEENRYDATPAREYISEAHRDEVAAVPNRGVLHHDLRDALARSHDAGGTHCLVGGDENDVVRVPLNRAVDDVSRAEDVVGHCIGCVFFHQGHVLVRCGMEYNMRSKALEHAVNPRQITNVPDHRGQIKLGM